MVLLGQAFLATSGTAEPPQATQPQPVKAQPAKAQPAKRAPNPAMTLPKVDPSLPNVLLIGDSISIGYTVATREALQGEANVYRPLTNCGPTTRGLEGLDKWLGDTKWDVIHFNFGLHDLKYMGPGGQNLADPDQPNSHVQVGIEDYEANIETIARRLKATGAKVIWRETSPVPDGARGRIVGQSRQYNEAAKRAIERVGGITIDPFYSFAVEHADLQKKADVHYTPEGSKVLGDHVAEVIRQSLKK
ncbi:SGNH/GDSL hydrolase family protein [Neorhodopirellula pilleata]|uniref:SGNH/GDSL hydrolase family protein n=1 Tax=Neorhodopirellula pilleata TaxID=2714738 RepID=UPI001E2ADF42|nr:SGNH/GDSL hydrolase family protein [Neorhodopirellula pilleata]